MRTSPFVVNFLAADVPFDDTFDPASLLVPAEKFALAAAFGVGLVGRPTPPPPLTVCTLLWGATEFLGIAQTCGCGDF